MKVELIGGPFDGEIRTVENSCVFLYAPFATEIPVVDKEHYNIKIRSYQMHTYRMMLIPSQINSLPRMRYVGVE